MSTRTVTEKIPGPVAEMFIPVKRKYNISSDKSIEKLIKDSYKS